MVAVLVGDENVVGLRELGGIVGGLAQSGDRVHLDGQAVVVDFERAVLDEGDGERLAAPGLEGLHLVAGGALRHRFVEALEAVSAGNQAEEGKE